MYQTADAKIGTDRTDKLCRHEHRQSLSSGPNFENNNEMSNS